MKKFQRHDWLRARQLIPNSTSNNLAGPALGETLIFFLTFLFHLCSPALPPSLSLSLSLSRCKVWHFCHVFSLLIKLLQNIALLDETLTVLIGEYFVCYVLLEFHVHRINCLNISKLFTSKKVKKCHGSGFHKQKKGKSQLYSQ